MIISPTKPPVTKSLLWLAVLGATFYISYGLSNWLASQQEGVPFLVFSWERHILFIAWTIVPYWTTNVFYAASLFLCRTEEEFSSHIKRLLTAQAIAIIFFVLTPLRFSFEKPETSGLSGFLFDLLGSFDKPFNQAPSLHVALTLILGALYLRILPEWGKSLFLAWSIVVVSSVLTTYQHHFIDIPTGALLGLFCIWLWPVDGHSRFREWCLAKGTQLRLAAYYLLGAVIFGWLAISFQGWMLWILWPSVSLLCVSFAYLGLGKEVFDKSSDGRIGWPSRIVLAPYLIAAWINSRLWTWKDKKAIEIMDGVYVGRYPSSLDVIEFKAIIDLTCEFHRTSYQSRYISFPMLDLVAPQPHELKAIAESIEGAQRDGPVLVACALGYGRSIIAAATWLLQTKRYADFDAALAAIRRKRPRLSLSSEQIQSIVGSQVGDQINEHQ